jgi:hypothetical protein
VAATSGIYGNYPGCVNTDEIVPPGRAWVQDQSSFGTSTRPGTYVSTAWDSETLMWDAHGNKGVDGLLPTDRTHVVKVYGSYRLGTGTTLGFNVYGGSGTPLSRTVGEITNYLLLADGRGSMGRTPFLSQTDVYVAQDFELGGDKKLRLELNVLNVFNQRTERHRVTYFNRFRLPTSSIDPYGVVPWGQQVDLVQGYDYRAMLEATLDTQTPPGEPISGYQDPQYDMPDIWNPGIQARLSVRFIF